MHVLTVAHVFWAAFCCISVVADTLTKAVNLLGTYCSRWVTDVVIDILYPARCVHCCKRRYVGASSNTQSQKKMCSKSTSSLRRRCYRHCKSCSVRITRVHSFSPKKFRTHFVKFRGLRRQIISTVDSWPKEKQLCCSKCPGADPGGFVWFGQTSTLLKGPLQRQRNLLKQFL